MHVDEALVRSVVEQVLTRLGGAPVGGGAQGRFGLFTDVDQAVAAAREAFEMLSKRTLDDRKRIVAHIRRIAVEQRVELGTMEMEETKIGRLEHKIDKLIGAAGAVGVEFLRSEVFSGDHGLSVIEHAPFGVICAITPVTHSLPTITCNAINMISSGNTVVFNPHPGGRRIAAEGVRRFNEAIYRDLGIDNLMCVLTEPTLESADLLFKHRSVNLIMVTGGPGVARAAMQQPKRAIVAGPGNPPVVVDETADLDRAARDIIKGGAYDNNLLCIAEKEVFAVDSIFDPLMAAMERAGAVRLNAKEIDALSRVAIATVGDGTHKHDVAAKEFIGKDASVLARAAGKTVAAEVEMLFGETDESNPFVPVEQMMPFVPFVRCRNVDEAIEKAKLYEHGFHHTALIHSNNVRNMTRMGKALDTTIFVKNGPCLAGLGNGGEGYGSYSIAGPTGEGITTPLTFTRERRCTMVDDLHILGN
ncbi:MAG: aldehyde dehydrogenase EutE [Planctomycetaceae bacterium]|nr:aldehyde dehydrogenase EutE [Planctomycetaceae bacterium]